MMANDGGNDNGSNSVDNGSNSDDGTAMTATPGVATAMIGVVDDGNGNDQGQQQQ